MTWEKNRTGEYEFSGPPQKETFGEGGIEEAKHYAWEQLIMLSTHPELDGRLFQRFAGALMAENLLIDEPSDVCLLDFGLTQNDVLELKQHGFLNGYRGNEGYTRDYVVAGYRRYLIKADIEGVWKVSLPPPLTSVH
ncbi:MAG TPA: hypothetical protein VLF90_01330 [Patescibacteria group bacterium]|nr:hypothetical protein [Patescibacteria group bacterium]